MFKTGLEDVLNKGSLKEINQSNFKFIDKELIIENPFNADRQTEENILKVKNSILESGLINPLIVVEKDGKYMIISGHARFAALQSIPEYNFQGNKRSNELIPVLIDKTMRSSLEKDLLVLKANAQKEETQKDKLNNVKKAQEIYLKLRDEKIITNQDKVKKREWIAQSLGYSESTVQRYLSEINTDENSKQIKEIDECTTLLKKIDDIYKKIDKIFLNLENEEKELIKTSLETLLIKIKG